ncbi:hypothetical protein CFP56_000460 [Quercus suber]|uniref:CCHC-type domain-containing protein n=1 Tax=Quercus suber TaxID=58331 RepID=A0AAW0MB51_QUESU
MLLKIDSRTTDNIRGRYARLCIEIDLDSPLTSKVRIGSLLQPIQYEGISAICFECGRVGHRASLCSSIIRPENVPNFIEPPSQPSPDSATNEFGEWMLVQRKKSPKQKNHNAEIRPTASLQHHAHNSGQSNAKYRGENSYPREPKSKPTSMPRASAHKIPITQPINTTLTHLNEASTSNPNSCDANEPHPRAVTSGQTSEKASVKATATHWIPTKTTVNLVPAPLLPENSSFNSKSFPNLANVSTSLNTESSAFTSSGSDTSHADMPLPMASPAPKPTDQPITILETSPDCPLNNDITMDVHNNLTSTSPNSDLQVNSTNNVSDSQSHQLLDPLT